MTNSRPIRLIATAAVALTALIAMPPSASAGSASFVTVPGKVTIGVGESVKVKLSTNPSTGYSWTTTIRGNTSAITMTKGKYKPPADTGMVGVPGVTVWTITGKAAGKAVITFSEMPPGGGPAASADKLTVTVR
jgi:predicted secreted protein